MPSLTNEEYLEIKEYLSRRFLGHIEIYPLESDLFVADSTSKAIIYCDNAPTAFLIVSSSISPEQMTVAKQNTIQCAQIVSSSMSRRLMMPLDFSVSVAGRSYAVYPYCFNIEKNAWGKVIARIYVAPFLLLFAYVLSKRSMHTIKNSVESAALLYSNLQFLKKLPLIDQSLLGEVSEFTDKTGLLRDYIQSASHGDFWIGNTVIEPTFGVALAKYGIGAIKIIDFGGFRFNGIFLFDALRVLISVNAPPLLAKIYLKAFLRLHSVEYPVARNSLIFGLAEMSMRLDHFPSERFVIMVNSMLRYLERSMK